jgi:hypothetical protein
MQTANERLGVALTASGSWVSRRINTEPLSSLVAQAKEYTDELTSILVVTFFLAIEWENDFATAHQLVPHAVTKAEQKETQTW